MQDACKGEVLLRPQFCLGMRQIDENIKIEKYQSTINY